MPFRSKSPPVPADSRTNPHHAMPLVVEESTSPVPNLESILLHHLEPSLTPRTTSERERPGTSTTVRSGSLQARRLRREKRNANSQTKLQGHKKTFSNEFDEELGEPRPSYSKDQNRDAKQEASSNSNQHAAFWNAYNWTADIEDKEFVKTSGGDLDVLLIFAGLFSATNTAFIAESYKSLQADPAEETNRLLHLVILIMQDSSSVANLNPLPFTPTSRNVRVNACFFVSLCCSLCAAFGAVLAKQWLTQYDKDSGGAMKPASGRAQERQLKFEGRNKWCLEHVIATLPTLLQFSLFFFLIGLIDFIWPVSTLVSSFIIAFSVFTFLFYIATMSISVIDSSSPFQTRLSAPLRRVSGAAARLPGTTSDLFSYLIMSINDEIYWELEDEPYWRWPWIFLRLAGNSLIEGVATTFSAMLNVFSWPMLRLFKPLQEHQAGGTGAGRPKPSVDTRCVVHLLERATLSEDLDMLADVLDSLPDDAGATKVAEAFITFHLKPSLGEWWHFPGLYGSTQKQILRILRILFVKWRYLEDCLNSPIMSFPPLKAHTFVYSLRPELWKACLMATDDVETYNVVIEILLNLPDPEGREDSDSSIWKAVHGWLTDEITTHLQNDDGAVLQQRSLATICSITGYLRPSWVFKAIEPILRNSSGLREMIRSTMWADEVARTVDTGNFWMAILRVHILPTFHHDGLLDSGFAEYLSTWFTYYATPDWRYIVRDRHRLYHRERDGDEQNWLYWSYILCLHRLLTKGDTQAWARELRKFGHDAHLLVILGDFPNLHMYRGAPVGLYLFLCLWVHGGLPGESTQLSGSLVTRDVARTVAHALASEASPIPSTKTICWYGIILFAGVERGEVERRVLADMVQMVEWLFSYLEACIQDAVLERERIQQVVHDYSRWCVEMDTALSTDRFGMLSERLHGLAGTVIERL